MKRFEVTIGEDFDVQAFNLDDVGDVSELSVIAASQARSRIQEKFALFVFGGISFALGVATTIGIVDGSFNEVGHVWSASALPLGYVLKAYFETPMPP